MSERFDFGSQGLGRRYDALNDGWRAAMIASLNLVPEDFQALTGALSSELTATPAGFAFLADRLPSPSGTAHIQAPGRMDPRFSEAYARLLGALLPEKGVGLRGFLGADYPRWVAFRNAARPRLPQRQLFGIWALGALGAVRRRVALAIFDEAATDAVSLARDALSQLSHRETSVSARGDVRHLPGYGVTPARARAAMFALKTGALHFDSDAMARADLGMLAPGSAPGMSLLPGAASPMADRLEWRVAASRIVVRGEIGARGVVPLQPGGWYDPDLVSRAYDAGPCAEVWDGWSGTGRWETFFGRRGAMRRFATQLVVVSDARLRVSVHGRFDMAERIELAARIGLWRGAVCPLRAAADRPVGLWPFVLPAGRSDMTAEMQFDDAGTLHLDLRLQPGHLQCWGIRTGSLARAV